MSELRRLSIGGCLIGLAVLACEREERRFNSPPAATPATALRVTQLQPGPLWLHPCQ